MSEEEKREQQRAQAEPSRIQILKQEQADLQAALARLQEQLAAAATEDACWQMAALTEAGKPDTGPEPLSA